MLRRLCGIAGSNSVINMEKVEQVEEALEKELNINHPSEHAGVYPTLHGDLHDPSTQHGGTYLDYRPDNLADVEKSERRESYAESEPYTQRSAIGVNVEQAEAEFAELGRQLTQASQTSRRLSRTQSRRSAKGGVQDVEKAISSESSEEGEPFDLETYMRGNKRLEDEAGIKGKQIGVIWENLTVGGIGGVKNYVQTFPDAFINFFNVYGTFTSLFGLGKKGKEVDILQNFKGVAKPGEMVLVLGRPGSGCTTFLKVIANQRFGYTKVNGEVLYGPFDSKTFEQRYRGEAVYNEEDDVHHPTLTVGQTLGFALETKVPGKRPAGMSSNDLKEKIVDMLLKMFNIEHTKNTIVGNPFVRGVSGGERKRVSIAEMMVTGATVCSYDNSTRGLGMRDRSVVGPPANHVQTLPLLLITPSRCVSSPTSTRRLHSFPYIKHQRTSTPNSTKSWLLMKADRSTLGQPRRQGPTSRGLDSSRSLGRQLLTTSPAVLIRSKESTSKAADLIMPPAARTILSRLSKNRNMPPVSLLR